MQGLCPFLPGLSFDASTIFSEGVIVLRGAAAELLNSRGDSCAQQP